ncbi:MAG: Acetate kinase [Verrucomicrobia bacterium ADurb.Bin345]|nr:MAG: Acetate kinase [Verrucomicrobia bacterium ADurb.Bin345]
MPRNDTVPPVNILVVNAGSSSLKFMMFCMTKEQMLAKGIVERIGLKEPNLVYQRFDGQELREQVDVHNHDDALKVVCEKLVDRKYGVLDRLTEVEAIGHRVVHGGEKFHDSTLITDEVKQSISDCASLAPLHNPPNLGGIEACERVFPGVPNIAVFDTAFHHSMPPASYLYAIPYEYYEKYGVRKYGFHGTSHKFVAQATAKFLGKPLSDLKLITCHLGNGASIAAVERGKSIDTSMGMTPLNGLVMGTRCGDIDPAVVLYLVRQGMKADDIDKLLNKKSGLLGVAGIGSSDMRDIITAAEHGNDQAKRALWMFVHRLVSYIGSYHTILGGANAVVFTGGIGENSAYIRARVIAKLACIGCYLDDAVNHEVVARPAIVSTKESTLLAVVMPTNEELMIARETLRVLKGSPKATDTIYE